MKVGAAATGGSIAGSSVGMIGGFVAGQMIIPIPVVGGILGCVAGGFAGGIVGTKTATKVYERFERKQEERRLKLQVAQQIIQAEKDTEKFRQFLMGQNQSDSEEFSDPEDHWADHFDIPEEEESKEHETLTNKIKKRISRESKGQHVNYSNSSHRDAVKSARRTTNRKALMFSNDEIISIFDEQNYVFSLNLLQADKKTSWSQILENRKLIISQQSEKLEKMK